jgi:asparagine N-glycosylation enzyme membrane subunit Stt3
MESDEAGETGWWKNHGPTVAILAVAFLATFLIRTLWNIPLFQQYGTSYFFAGGSDSFYHWRVSDYILLNHRNLIFDSSLRYPAGAINPREPLFDWMNAVFGIVFAPLFGGSQAAAGMFSLELAAPLWAALTVLPLYLVGKEVSSRRMGLIAALIWPFLTANIDSSTFGYANYLSFYTFFIILMIYAQLRTIHASGTRRWVSSYRKPREIWRGIRDYLYYEVAAVKWAVFTGVCFAVVILTWQGYTFLVALVVVFLVVQMVIERIRRIDSFGLYFTTWIVGLVGFPIAFPYYFVQGDYHIWFLEPVVIFFGALLVLLPFLLLRDSPWVLSIPVLVVTAGAAVGALALAAPAQFVDILSGQGYFVKTLIYTTVAEAQAPSIDSLIIGYGVVTFFLAFAGLGFVAYALVRGKVERRHLMFFVFAVISIYLPLSAAKFFYIGSAAFSLLPAEGLSRILDIGGYPTLRRNVISLADRRGQFSAFRRSFKVRHVLVLGLVLLIVVPNIWYATDAGIPYNSKTGYDLQVYDTLPPFLRTSPSNASNFYLGAAGGEIDTPNQYDEAGYDWLAAQDTNQPEPQRPALVSWWDYGFQTISEGHHPAVADNFQNGIDPSGNFLLAQNESLAIGVLTATLLNAEQSRTGQPYLPSGLNTILAADGVNLAELHSLLANTSADIPLVEAYPNRYLPVDPTHLDAQNAMYDAVSYFLATTLPLNGVARVYDDVQAYTGWTIRYDMVDSRLIPFSGSDTGIFYAPADLTDRVIGPGGEPTSYFSVSIVGSDGNTYPAGEQPPGVTPVSYNINYTPAFFNTMIYRTFFGYSGQEVGQASGIPWLSNTAQSQSDPLEPGWMLQHFEVAYRTAQACPVANASAGSSCFYAVNLPRAEQIQKKLNGTADTSPNTYFSGGEAILEYYPGMPVVGAVTLPDGQPVPDARVTVDDSWGIPHMTVVTGSDGAYSVLLPPGADVLNVTTGPLNQLTQQGTTLLGSYNVTVPDAYGFSLEAPTMNKPLTVKAASVQGTITWNQANSSASAPAAAAGVTLELYGKNRSAVNITTDATGSFLTRGIVPGTYAVAVLTRGANLSESNITLTPGVTYNESLSLSAGTILGNVTDGAGHRVPGATITVVDPAGPVTTVVSNSTGRFRISDLGPANYTLTASRAYPMARSQPVSAQINTAGGNVSTNLTIVAVVPVGVEVTRGGTPVAGLPVRFTELVPLTPTGTPQNNSTKAAPTQEKANTTVVLTGSDGIARAMLPAGNYSVYALGVNASSYLAGFWSGAIGPGTAPVPTIALAPAVELSGRVNTSTNASLTTPLEIAVYDSAGHVTWAFTNATYGYAIWLPAGHYGVQVIGTNPPQAGLSSVALFTASTLELQASPSSALSFSVVENATGLPIAGATLNFTDTPVGAEIGARTNSEGSVTVMVPSAAPPGPAASVRLPTYCINASAPGYLPVSRCGIAGATLPTVPPFRLDGAPVEATIDVAGLAAGVPITVNLTATSAGARSASVQGLPPLAVALLPGHYTVGAWAPGAGGARYLPVRATNSLTISPGAAAPTFALLVADQVQARGNLTLPSGALVSRTTLALYSSTMNLSLTGTAFENGFFAAPGSYQYVAFVPGLQAGSGRADYGTLTVGSTGSVSPRPDLTIPSISFEGTVLLPTGAPLLNPAVAHFTGPGGLSVPAPVAGGTFNVTLPINETFHESLNTTASFTANNTTVVEALHMPSLAACHTLAIGTDCDLHLVGTAVNLTVEGALHIAGSPAPVSGSVRFQGPAPSVDALTVSTAANGTFSTALPAGNYTVYASSVGGAYALLTTSSVSLEGAAPLDLTLAPAWSWSVTAQPPAGITVTAVTLTVRSPTGLSLVYPQFPLSSALVLPVPAGIYTATVSGNAAPFGVLANVTASLTVRIFTGNVATTLPMTVAYNRFVTATINGPSLAAGGNGTILLPPSGGVVALSFTVKNLGNIPVNVTVVGNPTPWNFTISPRNFTLGTSPASSTASGAFRVHVPAGTAVSHPPIILIVELAGTTQQVGESVLPPPVVIMPASGVALGASSSVNPSVTPTKVTLALYTRNTGNYPESIAVGVVDGARLAQLGWEATLQSGGTAVHGPLTVAVGGNTSLTLVLNATRPGASPPGTAMISATCVNRSGGPAATTLTVAVPVASVSVNGSAVIVTGPGVGSPSATPDWLVPLLSFVPAIAFLVVAVVYRWYRTRRWAR